MPGTGSDTQRVDTDRGSVPALAFGTNGAGTSSVLTSLTALSPERQRFALLLLQALDHVADEATVSEADLRNTVYRVFQAGVLQERRAGAARRELARVLGPWLEELDPVPYATVEQARRLAALRASLLHDGAWSTAAIADARGITTSNARQWVSRHRKAHPSSPSPMKVSRSFPRSSWATSSSPGRRPASRSAFSGRPEGPGPMA